MGERERKRRSIEEGFSLCLDAVASGGQQKELIGVVSAQSAKQVTSGSGEKNDQGEGIRLPPEDPLLWQESCIFIHAEDSKIPWWSQEGLQLPTVSPSPPPIQIFLGLWQGYHQGRQG